MIKKNLAYFLLLLTVSIHSQATKSITQRVQWKALDSAAGYYIEVVKEGNIDTNLFEYQLKLKHPYADLLLVPGTYFYRVTVLNRFQKASSQTQWQKLVIKIAKRPYFQYYQIESAFEGDKNLIVHAAIMNLIKGSQLFIKDPGNSISIKASNIRNLDKEEIEITFEIPSLKKGQYDLVCQNPSGLEDNLKKVIIIKERIQPNFYSISRRKLYVGEIFTNIEVRGSRFREGALITAPKASGIKISNVRFVDNHNFLIWIDLTDANPGNYQLTLTNPSGLADQCSLFQILEYADGARPDKVKTGFGIVARIPIVFGDIPDVDSPGLFSGFGLSLESDFGGFIPVLKWMGYSLFFEYKEIGSPWLAKGSYPYKMTHYINLGSSFYLTTRYDSPVNFFIEGGLGLSVHSHTYKEGETALDTRAMAGLYLMSGVGLDFSFRPDLIFRMGGEIQYSYAEDGEHLFPEFYIELGYRFLNNRKIDKYATQENPDS